jgi:hypothetical protein
MYLFGSDAAPHWQPSLLVASRTTPAAKARTNPILIFVLVLDAKLSF